MSTSDKLTYLNTTKTKIKDAINLTGANITNDTFRQYPTELYNSYLDIIKNGTNVLYNNMPKVTGSGSELSLQNTADAPMVLELGASDSTQKATTGKNKLNSSSVEQKTSNGITCSYDVSSQEITLNGTCTSDNTVFTFPNSSLPATQNVTTLTAYYVSGSASGTIGVFLFNSNYSNLIRVRLNELSDNNNILSATSSTTEQLVNNRIRLDNGAVCNNLKFKLMVADSTDTTYEQYTGKEPSPSPDFPQNINVVTGENSVKIYNKNLLDLSNARAGTSNGITITINSDGTYNFVGTATDTNINVWLLGAYASTTEIFTLPTGTYTVKDIILFNKYTRYSGTFTLTSDTPITGIRAVDAVIGNTYNEIKYPQLEENPTATSYVPHQEQNLLLNLGSLELVKIGNYQDKIFNNVPSSPLYDSSLVEGGWYKYKAINKMVLDGSENDWYKATGWALNRYNLNAYDTQSGSASNNPILATHFRPEYGGTSDKTIFIMSGYGIGIIFNDITSLQEFKTWLSNNNVLVYYALAVPTNELITDTTLVSQLEALKNADSYDDETNISQTNANRPFVISASAIKNSME